MKYVVSKTSLRNKEKPCDEAFEDYVEYWHTRTCSEKEYNERFAEREGGKWRELGKNHTVDEDGYITRQEDDIKEWCINIDSLDDLNSFIDKYVQIVIKKYHHNYKDLEIEIYDSYRE